MSSQSPPIQVYLNFLKKENEFVLGYFIQSLCIHASKEESFNMIDPNTQEEITIPITNQSAELHTVLQFLQMVDNTPLLKSKSLQIFLPSNFSFQCLSKWIHGWSRNNWIASTSQKPVRNKEIIQYIYERYLAPSSFYFEKITFAFLSPDLFPKELTSVLEKIAMSSSNSTEEEEKVENESEREKRLVKTYAKFVTPEEIQAFCNKRTISKEQSDLFCQCEQRTNEWFESRKYRLTASNFGAANGNNPYKSRLQLVYDLMYGKFQGNAATRYGTEMEPVAFEAYQNYIKSLPTTETFSISEQGLYVQPYDEEKGGKNLCWLGCSPDGLPIINGENGLLEIKCPYRKKLYPSIPPYYYDQIQGIMGLMKLPWCDFYVWTPNEIQCERFLFDEVYFDKLIHALEYTYKRLYVPALILREKGMLEPEGLELVLEDVNPIISFEMSIPTQPKKPPRPHYVHREGEGECAFKSAKDEIHNFFILS